MKTCCRKLLAVDHSVAQLVNHTICCRVPKSLMMAATVSVVKVPAESGDNTATALAMVESVMVAG